MRDKNSDKISFLWTGSLMKQCLIIIEGQSMGQQLPFHQTDSWWMDFNQGLTYTLIPRNFAFYSQSERSEVQLFVEKSDIHQESKIA